MTISRLLDGCAVVSKLLIFHEAEGDVAATNTLGGTGDHTMSMILMVKAVVFTNFNGRKRFAKLVVIHHNHNHSL